MNVLSLFDGISCGQQTLKELNIKIDNYFSSEIEQFSIDITNKNFKNTIQLGDINNYKEWNLPKIDLIMGGSPCQGFSNAGKGLNFDDPRSKLFFKFVECIDYFKPKFFLLENVKMSGEYVKIINKYMKTTPFELKSSYFNIPQHRPRLFWTNISLLLEPFQITKKCIVDILEKDNENNNNTKILLSKYFSDNKIKMWDNLKENLCDFNFNRTLAGLNKFNLMKSKECLYPDNVLLKYDGIFSTLYTYIGHQSPILTPTGKIRHLTIIEEERLQGLPDNYTLLHDSNDKKELNLRKKALGNGWTIPVIKYIISFINIKKEEV